MNRHQPRKSHTMRWIAGVGIVALIGLIAASIFSNPSRRRFPKRRKARPVAVIPPEPVRKAPKPVAEPDLPPEEHRDIVVMAPERMLPNTTASIRVFVFDRDDDRLRPMAGVNVAVSLLTGDIPRPLFSASTDGHGTAQDEFTVPDLQGAHTLLVSASGVKLSRPVTIGRTLELSLETDRQIYRARGRIHARATAGHGRPVANLPVSFEIVDPRGNKILRRTIRTGSYGVAETVLPLADELIPGSYEIRATAGDVLTKRKVQVSHEPPPVIEASVEPTQKYPWAGQTLEGTISARYWFGAPARGHVKGTVTLVADREYPLTAISGFLNEEGRIVFTAPIPIPPALKLTESAYKRVRIEATITDSNRRTVDVRLVMNFVSSPVRVSVRPESGYLVPNADNRFWVFTSWADGVPGPMQVTVQAQNEKYVLATDKNGIGTFTIPHGQLEVGTKSIDPLILAKDSKGNSGISGSRWEPPSDQSFRLALESFIVRAGNVLPVRLNAPADVSIAWVDLIVDRQVRRSIPVMVRGGRGAVDVPIHEALSGEAELHAYTIRPTGKRLCHARACLIKPSRELQVRIEGPKEAVGSDEETAVRVRVTDNAGRGVRSAVHLALHRTGSVRPEIPEGAIVARLARQDGIRKSSWRSKLARRGHQPWSAKEPRALDCSCDGRRFDAPVQPATADAGWFSIETDQRGEATVAVRAPYGTGEWNLAARAISQTGVTGLGKGAFRAEPDFLVDVGLPPALTRGDEVHVPIHIYNNLRRPQLMKVEATPGTGFTSAGLLKGDLKLAPRELGTFWVRVQADRVGSARLAVRVRGKSATEQWVREIDIAPDGKVFEEASSFFLSDDRTERFRIPEERIDGSERLFLRITPGPAAQALEGLEGLLKRPHG